MTNKSSLTLLILTTLSLILNACAAPQNVGGTITVVSDLPMTGSAQQQTQTIVFAITQAFESKNNKVCDGKWRINYRPYDDASTQSGNWDADVTARNAKEYVTNTNIVAVIGTYNSDAAAIMIPILNPEQLVMISPSNTWPGLTKSGKGKEGEPEKYYPNKIRNYSRVVPSDDIQGYVGALWAKSLGAKSVFIFDDQELYGKGLADVFEKSAKEIGLKVMGHEGIDRKLTDYKTQANKVMALNPDMIYYGGTTQNNAAVLIKNIRNAGFKGIIMGADGIREEAFIKEAGEAANDVYVTFGGIPQDKMTGKASEWRDLYKTKFQSNPETYTIYGYVAAEILLDAFERVCKSGKPLTDRAAIREAIFATKDFNSVIGKLSIDANGDTTLLAMSGSQVRKGKFEFVTLLGQ